LRTLSIIAQEFPYDTLQKKIRGKVFQLIVILYQEQGDLLKFMDMDVSL